MDTIEETQTSTESSRTNATTKQFLALIHGWMGLVSGVFVLIIAITGIGLAFFGELFELQYGDMLRAEKAPHTRLSAIIESAEQGHGNNFTPFGLFMPDTRVENLETALVYGRADGTETDIMMVSVDAATAEYKGSFELEHAFAHEFNDFHFSLLMGEWAQLFMTVIGLLIVAFAFTGIYMWWPKRNALRKATKLQTKGKLKALFFNWHGLAGVWLSLFMLYFALTGSALSQPNWFSSVLGRMEDPPKWDAKFRKNCGEVVSLDEAEQLALDAFPDRQISSYVLVSGEMQKYVFSLKGEGDLDKRMGDAMAQVHATCKNQIYTSTLSKEPLSVKLGNQLLSLHGGHIFGPFTEIINVITGLALSLLSISGIYVFLKTTLPVSRKRRNKFQFQKQ